MRYAIFPIRLDPKVAAAGDTVDFSAYYSNPGQDTVHLDTTNTVLSFTDGLRTASGNLSTPQYLLPGTDSSQIFFNNTEIPGDMVVGNYTPTVDFEGTSDGQNISGTLAMDPGELSLAPLEILSITFNDPIFPAKRVVQGDTVRYIQMLVRNNSLFQVNNLSGDLLFVPDIGTTLIPDPANAAFLASRQSTTLRYIVPVPAGAPLDTILVDGSVDGNLAINGNYVFDDAAPTPESFEIISGASVTLVSYTPTQVSENQSVGFEVTVNNSGVANVVLNQTQTTLDFGGQVFNLNGDQVIASGTNSTLRFAPLAITLISGNYAGILNLSGTQNGVPYQDSLQTGVGDSLTVQSASLIAVSTIQLSDTVVSQSETGQTLSVRVVNSGEASAQISSRDSIVFNYNSSYALALSSGQSFPVTIAGGDSDLFVYDVVVDSFSGHRP